MPHNPLPPVVTYLLLLILIVSPAGRLLSLFLVVEAGGGRMYVDVVEPVCHKPIACILHILTCILQPNLLSIERLTFRGVVWGRVNWGVQALAIIFMVYLIQIDSSYMTGTYFFLVIARSFDPSCLS